MREILFKAKVKDWEQKPKDEQWVYGYYVRGFNVYEEPIHMIFDTTTMFFSHGETDGWDEIDENTICQYTGLTDKNGCKIWENDIVSFSHSRLRRILSVDAFGFPDFEMAEYKRNYAIEFVNTYNHYGLRFRNKSIHFPCKCSTLRMHEVEVIGNIFDNSELLKGE